ncbi:MAG: ClbS/DfsB family four-helix bundle protein [Lachnospiraceae bacterium]|nr:ClbS/DfsB family four-helix bundle protein [Lachnospiraceae bacterium]
MPRPTTKQDLILAANQQFDKLWNLIETMSEEEKSAVLDFDDNIGKGEAHWKRDKNLRDVLIHLHEWHRLLLNWVSSNQKGEAKPFLPEPYNWKTYGDMNVMFWEKHQATSYDEAKEMLCDSHKNVLALIEQFSTEELFTKKVFSWVGGSTLGSYCVSVTASHYDWAMKKIKAHIKICRGK